MRVRFPSPHAKRRCRIKTIATLNSGADGEGQGSAATTTNNTTPCSAAAKAWIVASNRPKAPSPVAGGGTIWYPTPTGTPQLTGTMTGSGGGWVWYLHTLFRPVVVDVGMGIYGVGWVGYGRNPKGQPLPPSLWKCGGFSLWRKP